MSGCQLRWRYRAPTKAGFAQRLRRLREWTQATLPDSPMRTHTLDLCEKRAQFSLSYDHKQAHRTSNLVDRLMRFRDRACFNAQYFHGTLASAELRVRALALLWNFCPSSPATVKKYHGQRCPAERLNGKRYSENWLENLLVSCSMNGLRYYQQNPLLKSEYVYDRRSRRAGELLRRPSPCPSPARLRFAAIHPSQNSLTGTPLRCCWGHSA
jgi:hypothetical protein